MALAAVGSYRIIRRAFQPLDAINATAAAINEARDLSRRIGLPPGEDEFSRLGSSFDELFERLERSFEAEKQFTANLPMSCVRQYLLLKEHVSMR